MTMMMSDSNSNVKVIIHMHETFRHNSHAITGMSLPVLIETLKMYLLQRNQAEIHLEHICQKYYVCNHISLLTLNDDWAVLIA